MFLSFVAIILNNLLFISLVSTHKALYSIGTETTFGFTWYGIRNIISVVSHITYTNIRCAAAAGAD